MIASTLPLPLPAASEPRPDHSAAPALRKVAEEFEAVALTTMLASMFAGISSDGPLGGGYAEDTYRGLLVEEYASTLSRAGGVGIADSVYRDLLALQEVTPSDE